MYTHIHAYKLIFFSRTKSTLVYFNKNCYLLLLYLMSGGAKEMQKVAKM